MYIDENIHMRLILISQLIKCILYKIESGNQVDERLYETLSWEMNKLSCDMYK